MLTRSTPAKVNLFLNLRGLRNDGFHEMVSIMQAVSIEDQLTLTPQSFGSGIRLTTNHSELSKELEINSNNNLIVNAYDCFWKWVKQPPAPIQIHLEKNIPIQAGMGGGSSDAAATLLLLDEFAKTRLSTETLKTMAATLGSDVPFFIQQGTALATGRGEQITPLDLPEETSPLPLLIVKPRAFGISTAKAYALCRSANAYCPVDETPLKQGLLNNSLRDQLFPLLLNDFEPILFPHYPVLNEIAQTMKGLGVLRPFLSGSGPTMIGFLSGSTPLELIQARFPSGDYQVFITETRPHRITPTCATELRK